MADRHSRPVGCLLLLIFFVLEIAVCFGLGYVFYRVIFGLFETLGWTGERDFAQAAAVFFALICVAPFVWWVDKQCKRFTGQSAMEAFTLPF